MALKSASFKIDSPRPQTRAAKKAKANSHLPAMAEVVEEARGIARDRRRALEGIPDKKLRSRAAG